MKRKNSVQKVAMAGMIIAFMFTFGYIFEATLPEGIVASIVNPNPMEALIIVSVVLLGVKYSIGVSFGYLTLILITKPTKTSYVGEVALIVALLSYIGAYQLAKLMTKAIKLDAFKKGVVRVAIAAIIMCIWMTFINFIWITPAYAAGMKLNKFVWDITNDYFTAMDLFKYIAKPFPIGIGIIHGNLIKYGLAGALTATLWRTPFMKDYRKPESKIESK